MAIYPAGREIAAEAIDSSVSQVGSPSPPVCGLVAGGLIRQVTVTLKVTVTLVFAGDAAIFPAG